MIGGSSSSGWQGNTSLTPVVAAEVGGNAAQIAWLTCWLPVWGHPRVRTCWGGAVNSSSQSITAHQAPDIKPGLGDLTACTAWSCLTLLLPQGVGLRDNWGSACIISPLSPPSLVPFLSLPLLTFLTQTTLIEFASTEFAGFTQSLPLCVCVGGGCLGPKPRGIWNWLPVICRDRDCSVTRRRPCMWTTQKKSGKITFRPPRITTH